LYDVNDKKAVNKVRKSLKRMAKDDKNTEYLAQIYYELGKLELSQSNFAAAIFAFKKSNENAQTNITQKAKSCLELAQLFFETKEYKLAKAYYDTTVSIYDKKSSKYGAIMATKVALNELINNINVYEREDSLQQLSKLSKTELDKKVSNWIESDKKRKMLEAKEAKRKKQIESSLEANKFENGAPNVPVAFDNSAGGANWYFYNTNLINSGIVDFFSGRKWGNRINEDFWRLSNKEKANLVGSTDAGTDSSEQENKNKPIKTDDKIEAAQIDNKPVENKTVSVFGDSLKDLWVKDVPFTEEALETSNLSMMEALHNLGILYYSKIKNFKEAITYFNLLESKFPASEYEPEAWYYLYKSHSEIKENDNASKYKSDLIAKYPTDKFTLLLEGKSSKTSSTDQNKELVILYDHTFDAYKNGNYLEVKSLKEEADKKFPGNTFRPKFELLYALALAKTDSLSVFKQALNNIIKEFPKTDVSDQATSILAVLDKSEIKQKIVGTDTNMVTFDMEPESAHYYIMAIKSNKANFTEYTDKIFTYNEAYAMNDNLKVNVLMSNDGFQYLLVREFPNLKKAESYYKGVLANKVIESKLKVTEPYFDFVISTSNYKKIMRDKQIEAYSKYYKKILLTQSQ
jgi:outer membrane protein assembly factor BamD (BamD/ComL family)